ncbi:hypothetical protein AVEN_199307-1 [Araneus ventricosus]|uniref:LSM domain-containing protein n=1 Tax=Araneus ventricosus TaxID=182803 RepID=A0A4Y2H8L5_ARAVE|nr:hypothetical protein AVEN_199307-1 [Araneus ventricosus]
MENEFGTVSVVFIILPAVLQLLRAASLLTFMVAWRLTFEPNKENPIIWIRNFEGIRGICTGYGVAFDKHWNVILSDVDEDYVKTKKAKSPYLDPITAGDLPELPRKVPKDP